MNKIASNLSDIPVAATTADSINGSSGYLIGGIIALLILLYLIYALVRPDKF